LTDSQPNQKPYQASASGAAIFAVLVVAGGIFVGTQVRLMPPIASAEAAMVDRLYSSMLGIAAGIFFLVEGALLYAVLRFRKRRGHEGEGVATHGDNQLEIAWTVAPALIVFWLAAYSSQVLVQLHEVGEDAELIQVTTWQFSWEFEYPDYGITSSDLHVPVGTPVILELTSKDVIHSLWIPAFRIKQDARPMATTTTNFTAELVGEYPIVCAELCGVGHSLMRSRVIVHEQAEYERWLEEAGG
jgi:cytochrome c oxidase subunit 2